MEKGIGSLPMSGSQEVDPSLFDNEIARIAKENPSEFGDSLVTGLGEIDPQLVEEFKRDLAKLKPSAALIDALQEMVDEILANPQNYESIRQKYLNQEVPEELLPAFFDAAFFGGLDLALIELEKNVQRPEPPVEMAEGGVASIAQAIAKMGRRGDTMLAHITPEEARLLRRRGGSGTINPRTGLPEFFIKKIFKSAKSILKGVGRAINKIAKSDIGRIALTIAATYYMGPAGFNIGAGTFSGATLTAVQTAAGSTLVNLAAGESLKDSLKNGIMSGATAGFGQAIGAALPADVTNPYLRTGIGTALAGTGAGLARGQSFEEALRSGVEGAAQSAALQRLQQPFTGTSQKLMSKLPQVPESLRTTVGTDTVDPITGLIKGTGKAFDTARSGIGGLFTKDPQDGSASFPVSSPDVEIIGTKAPIEKKSFSTKQAEEAAIRNFRIQNPTSQLSDQDILEVLEPTEPIDFLRDVGGEIEKFVEPIGSYALDTAQTIAGVPIAAGQFLTELPGYALDTAKTFGEGVVTGFGDPRYPYGKDSPYGPNQGEPIGFAPKTGRILGQGTRLLGAVPAGLVKGTQDMYSSFKEPGPTSGDANFAQKTGDFLERRYIDAKEFLPTDERRLKLEAKLRAQQEANAITEKAAATEKYERGLFAPNNPELNKELYFNRMKAIESAASAPVKPSNMSMYGPAAALGLGALYAGGAFDSPQEEEGGLLFDPYTFQMFDRAYSPNMYSGLTYRRYNPYLYAQGGDVEKFPRKTGAINGPGTGTSDSIPAMLSDGEFVMTAKAVRSMGNGSRRKGAAKMYKLMRELEKRTA